MAGVDVAEVGMKRRKRKPLRSWKTASGSRRLKGNAYWRRSPIRDLAFPHVYYILQKPDIRGARWPAREQVFLSIMYQHQYSRKLSDPCRQRVRSLKASGQGEVTTKNDANIRKNVKIWFEEYQALTEGSEQDTNRVELTRKIWKGRPVRLFDIYQRQTS
ncbi:hypothetical protein GWK47_052873 [Chionoecetes opilio]|uniref:Uncharacterized protein n=1 Tax=Chionoecetes opilio TaxID=41210 RepID=A0A8J4XZL8_CHIOP|nr:hypothetical protein GWK47_052873 [Chionoecetes opilio]